MAEDAEALIQEPLPNPDAADHGAPVAPEAAEAAYVPLEKVEPAPEGDDEYDQVMPLPSDDKPQAADPGRTEPGRPVPKGPEKGDDRLIKVKGLDKQQLCIDLLMVGCVQSFVDFFYITHRKSAPTETVSEQETEDVDIPEATLIFLKETLETAEIARRSKNYQHCFESYNSLAEYFDEKVHDLKSAMYFYQRCADVATEVDAKESISKANLNLGSCEEKGNNWHSAMQFHERALTIATSADSLPLQIKAASRLTHVYQILAEKCEKEGRDADATQLYERCLSCAQLSKDATLEGNACHRLGLSKYKTGHYEPAIDLQKQYLEICRMHDDRIGESNARAALAHAYEAVGNAQEAIKQLENLLNVASEAGELQAQASACLNLGILYNGRSDHEKSVELLEQHFDLARQLGDRKLIDSARVVLGIVRGNGKLKAYVDLVNNDLDKLLKWKSKRMTLETS
jgi:tetratricopeptide (TPR) repeat protein